MTKNENKLYSAYSLSRNSNGMKSETHISALIACW